MLSEQLQKKVDRALKLLQSVAPTDGSPVEVAYSGGKDSDVILQLVKESGIAYRAIYKNTTIDPPGTIKHAKEMGAEVVKPKRTFSQLIEVYGFPSRWYRFCCQQLKEYHYDKTMHKVVMGVRKDESVRRSKRYNEPTECIGTKKDPNEAIYPILDWTGKDVKEFILDRSIKCSPVYYDEQGEFHEERRLGCLCCPLASKKKRIEQFKQFPKMLLMYAKQGQKYLDAHKDVKTAEYFSNVYEWLYCSIHFENRLQPFREFDNSLFGKPDYKSLLEEQFGIDLTIKQVTP